MTTSIFNAGLYAGKHVFVTGGSSGINLRIAEAFGEHGPALPASTTLPQRRRLSTQVRARQASRRGTASTRYGHAGVTVEERPLSGCR